MAGTIAHHAGTHDASAHDASPSQQKIGLWSNISFFTSFVTLGFFASCPRRKAAERISIDKHSEDDGDGEETSTTAGSDSSPSSADEASSGTEDCDSSAEENSETDTEGSASSPEESGCSYPRQVLLQLRTRKPSVAPAVRYTTQQCTTEEPKTTCSPKEKLVSAGYEKASWRTTPKACESQSVTSAKMVLTPSATSWAARQQQRRQEAAPTSQEDLQDAEVVRRVKSILNKLTIEKFDALYTQLTECGLRKAMHVELLVGEVFEKATTQHRFIAMYADLCSRLDKHFSNCPVVEGSCNFRRVLLDQCQSSFEKSLVPPPELSSQGASEEDQLEAQNRYKQRMLGNIRLVGELLVRKMLSPRILLACAEELISQPKGPDRMESLAALLTTVGPKFDNPSWAHHALLDGVFMRVSGLVSCPGMVSARARFLLQDVLDLRSAGWVDKKLATKVEGPKKIDDVHREAAQEATQVCHKSQAREKDRAQPAVRSGASSGAGRAPTASDVVHSGKNAPGPTRRLREEAKSGKAETRDPTRLLGAVKALAEMPLEGPLDKAAACPKTTTRSAKSTPQEVAAAKAKKADECSRSLAAILSASEKLPSAPGSPATGSPTHSTRAPAAPAVKTPSSRPYDLASFHTELSAVMRGLAAHNVTTAVSRIRGLQLPVTHQAAEFTNIITRGAEEANSAKRRAAFAFAAGLLAQGVFDRNACTDGVHAFCADVYEDLREEVPGLRAIVVDELLPALHPALPDAQRSALCQL